MIGFGRYQWIDLAGNLQTATHWDQLPEKMKDLVAFVPDYPEPPHTDEQHQEMETFTERLQEALSRCVA